MSSAITFRFTQNHADWRVLCQASDKRCFIWKDGAFVRSATYTPKQGFADEDRVIADVVPRLLHHLAPLDPLFTRPHELETRRS